MNYPPLRVDHLARLSDSTGILQHARWTVPDPRFGYTLDDNTRAFVVALKAHRHTGQSEWLEWARRYLAFMIYAQSDDGWFRNFADYDRRWLEEAGSPDSNGRAMWALGYGVHSAPEAGMRDVSMWMFDRAQNHLADLTSPRAVASALLGCAEVHAAGQNARPMLTRIERCAGYLAGLFDQVAHNHWPWFERSLTYGNATLSQAMIIAGKLTHSGRYLEIGRRSLDFLIDLVFDNGGLDLIGHDGWYVQGAQRANFDQQPIDAGCMVEALLVAHQTFDEPRYGELAHVTLQWFYGRNRIDMPLYDESSGGCRDALMAEGVNQNQGAESTLAHLAARLAIEEGERAAIRTPMRSTRPTRG